MVLASAAFGQETHWGEAEIPPGHAMSFRDAVVSVSGGIGLRAIFPDWVWGDAETREKMALGGIASKGLLGPRVKHAAIASAEMQVGRHALAQAFILTHAFCQSYMQDMVDEQLKFGGAGRRDIFTQLLQTMEEDEDTTLKDVFGSEYISAMLVLWPRH